MAKLNFITYVKKGETDSKAVPLFLDEKQNDPKDYPDAVVRQVARTILGQVLSQDEINELTALQIVTIDKSTIELP